MGNEMIVIDYLFLTIGGPKQSIHVKDQSQNHRETQFSHIHIFAMHIKLFWCNLKKKNKIVSFSPQEIAWLNDNC